MNSKNSWKKITILAFIFMLVIPFFQGGVKVKARELTNVIDSVQVTHQDGSTTGNFDFYEEITSNFTWSAKTNDLKNGDTFTVQLSDNIHVANNITFPLMTGDNQVAGEVVVNAAQNLMTVTFNDYVEGRANVKGTIQLQDFFNIQTTTQVTVVPLTYTFNGTSTTVDVNVNPTPVVDPDEVLIKGGVISTDDTTILKWNARLNYANNTINNAVIIDTLGPGQEFIQDSVVLSKQSFDQYGNAIPPTSVVPTSDYTLTFNSPTKMTIELGDINQSYNLSYQTKITDSTLPVYTNTISIDGDNFDIQTINVESDATSGSGTAGGDYGSFELTKVDKDNHNVTLGDAEFKIVSDVSGATYNLITDYSGKASLSNIPLGSYTLTETKAPVGYVIDSNPVRVTINSDSKTTYTFENEQIPPANGAIEVTKVDSEDAAIHLADAEFNLIDGNKNVVTTVSTDKNGGANLSDLAPGKYQLVETKAPAGYELNEKPIDVTVKSEETTNITVKNTQIKLTPPTPSNPTVPGRVVKPTKTITVKPTGQESTKSSEGRLPETGDTNQTTIFVLLGSMLLLGSYRIIKIK
ncbi:MSCRAMM family protein [Listeria monocytogenes]|uniref:MSCRAMM family protein n=1 Tax=Listeria monocytogenes TaxID=1639 RepID=UPI0010BC175B|nr:SpaA isopeptide-forming pilin-related protein [Listeria monocytogenes]EAC3456766.1 LPXTG cell wall anchor domain-containing protein [Listeria monocytogenes]EAC4365837.1 LPXTG cell wall anchor domain-containing protein [Listeria monocytogenes]EAC4831158.1 LPXTG cell wall anchor domain-containing protein [Listeria monocytogenes]EAC7892587.1 LPXTG cell wall anchor domain-containing protein [Listeria monocytogenes]EAC8844125.1 LPXTG cell wall anchor domain-containing protein [Listeria monocytog